MVKPATRQRYAKCFQLFVLFLRQQVGFLPAVPSDYDACLARFIEFLWHEGETKATAATTLAAVQYYVPQLRRQLPLSWKLKSTWDSLELPCQAAPMTPSILFAFVHQAMQNGWEAFGWLCLVMFLGFLRTGEALSLLVKHVAFTAAGVVLTLWHTKGTQRAVVHQHEEILLEDPLAVWACKQLVHQKCKGDSLAGMSSYTFRKRWFDMVQHFALQRYQFQPYSLRRGGATHFFHVSGSMHRTLLLGRGRWKHVSTARLYLQQARAAAQALDFPVQVTRAISNSAIQGRRFLKCQLGTHGRDL